MMVHPDISDSVRQCWKLNPSFRVAETLPPYPRVTHRSSTPSSLVTDDLTSSWS